MEGYVDAVSLQPLLSALDWLGVNQVRTMATAGILQAPEVIAAIAARGLVLDMVLPSGKAPEATVAALADLALLPAGTIGAIEGLNEVNNWPVTCNGRTGLAAAIAFMDTAAAVRASPSLAGVELYDLTGASRSTQLAADGADDVNLHPFHRTAANPTGFCCRGLPSMPCRTRAWSSPRAATRRVSPRMAGRRWTSSPRPS